jgi:hypothetical protein
LRNGDISNELPKRILVTTDMILNVEVRTEKKFKLFKVPKVSKSLRREAASHLYLIATRREITLELISFDLEEDQLSSIMDWLDTVGTNPFRYYSVYESINHLVKELPFRPEIVGVLDLPQNLLRYGHWGLDMGSL